MVLGCWHGFDSLTCSCSLPRCEHRLPERGHGGPQGVEPGGPAAGVLAGYDPPPLHISVHQRAEIALSGPQHVVPALLPPTGRGRGKDPAEKTETKRKVRKKPGKKQTHTRNHFQPGLAVPSPPPLRPVWFSITARGHLLGPLPGQDKVCSKPSPSLVLPLLF